MPWFLIDIGCRTPVPFVPVDDLASPPHNVELAIDIDRLLHVPAAAQPRRCTVVQMSCFLALTHQKAAEVLGMPLCTLQSMWHDSRKRLRDRMEANATS
jgi:DNA-directed RNA polymerase specialized sigma24 family protein